MAMEINNSNIDYMRATMKEYEKSVVTSKAETLDDLKDTTGKSFKTADLEKLMEKYDPDAYAEYSKRNSGGIRSQSGLSYLSAWIDKVKKGFTDEAKASSSKSVADYYSKLQKNHSCLSSGNVNISSKYLEKCAGDSQKAKELEDFFKKIPELEKQGYEQLSARNAAMGGKVTYYQQTWMINEDGSVQSSVYSVTDTGMTNAERMKKSMDERLEKQKEKKEEEKKAAEKKEAKEKLEATQKKETNDSEGEINTIKVDGRDVSLKYISVESKEEAEKMMRREDKREAYHKGVDVSV